ncbi:MAG TPA: hypothetical protein VGN88_09485 [Phycisphaerae bacterium]|jgi:hypothetical protein
MSELPPESPPPIELAYETPAPSGNAPMLVRLAGIFLLCSAGLDLMYLIYQVVITVIMGFTGSLSLGGAPGMPPVLSVMVWVSRILPIVLGLVAGTLKTIGGIKLLLKGKHAWGLGLTGGIAASLEFWSCPCCFLSIAAGVYTIVILCLGHVRVYLRMSQPTL